MILTLVIAGLAGAFYPRLKPFVAQALSHLGDETSLAEMLEVASFGTALLLAAALTVLIGAGGNAVLVVAGGLIGLLHQPIKGWIMARLG